MDTLCLLCWAAESKWSTCLAAAWSLGRTVHLSAYFVDTHQCQKPESVGGR
jgi:hypothetical protein